MKKVYLNFRKWAMQCWQNIIAKIHIIEYIIESGFGIRIDPVPLKVQFAVEAFPAIGKNIIYVDIGLMDDERQERRYRFTLAEELAHIILHADIYKKV